MDLKAIVRNAVDTVFDITDSIKVSGVYHRVTQGAYDPQTGTEASSEQTFSISIRVGMFEQNEIDNVIVQAGDKKLFIKTADLPPEPMKDDYFVDGSNVRWDVAMIGIEPTTNLWILRGRARRG